VISEIIQQMVCVQDQSKILFKGSSCYPISPTTGQNDEKVKQIDSNDQLLMILGVLGNQKRLDKEFFTRKDMHAFYTQCLDYSLQKPIASLADIHQGISNQYISFLELFLQVDPRDRATIDKCIKHPLFDEIRSAQKEKDSQSPTKVELKVDRLRLDDHGRIDPNDYSVASLRRYICGYVQKI
jgi:serine/threonine protein kinase